MSAFLLLQQRWTNPIFLTWTFWEIRDYEACRCCFSRCWSKKKIDKRQPAFVSSSHVGFRQRRFVRIQVMQTNMSSDKESFSFICYTTFTLVIQAYSMHMFTIISVDKTLQPIYQNWSSNFSGLSFNVIWFHLVWISWTLNYLSLFFRQCSWDSVWTDVFAKSGRSSP